MTRRARVTQGAICQAIRAARQTGAGTVRIMLDGSICIDPYPSARAPSESKELASKWDDAPPVPRRRFGDRIAERADPSDPLAAAFARWERGEIAMDQLPPGSYPNGLRVYADGEWEAIIRSKPLGKREVGALKAYFEADGANGFYSGGYDTNNRLVARGLIESSTGQEDHKAFRITAAGKNEWLKQLETRATKADNP